jgi:hypothetical protein
MDKIELNYNRLKVLEKEFIEKKKLLDADEINSLEVENKKLKEEIKDYKELQKLIQKLGKSITMKI